MMISPRKTEIQEPNTARMDPSGERLSILVLEDGAELDRLRERCEEIEFATVHSVSIHEDHKRFSVRFSARRGAECQFPKTWMGIPVVLERV